MSSIPGSSDSEVVVWDPLVRVFHWSLVASFTVAYLSGEGEALGLHAWSGYSIGGLILFRVLWGLVGPRHARFADFVFTPATILGYGRDLLLGQAQRYLGHNPLGGAMVIALLLMLALATLTGVALYGATEAAGPLAGMLHGTSHGFSEVLEEVHEFFSNLTLMLVALHIGGVLVSSLRPPRMAGVRKTQERFSACTTRTWCVPCSPGANAPDCPSRSRVNQLLASVPAQTPLPYSGHTGRHIPRCHLRAI